MTLLLNFFSKKEDIQKARFRVQLCRYFVPDQVLQFEAKLFAVCSFILDAAANILFHR